MKVKSWLLCGVLAASMAGAVGSASAQNTHTLPLVLPASSAGLEGFVRIVNRSGQAGTVRLTAINDDGERFGPVTLALDANEAVHFRSRELEQGNAAKGLPTGVGDGEGYWRLVLETGLVIQPLAYIRTSDGFVTSMHDVVPVSDGERWVVFFNPGSNDRQVSQLRLINPGTTAAEVEVTARDDAGAAAPGGAVRLTLPAGASRLLTAQELETGGDDFAGSLGDGAGKWWLSVTSNAAIEVMSLLRSPTGHLANLSTALAAPEPRAMPGCADEAEFTRLAVGNELYGYFRDPLHLRFLEGNRFEESEETYDPDGGPRAIGSYVYRKIGPSTATVEALFDDRDGARCFLTLSCTSPTTGTIRNEFCTQGVEDGEIVAWEIFPPGGRIVSGSR